MIYSCFQLLCTVWGVLYLQARGLSQQVAANCVTGGWLGYAVACPLLGILSDHLKKRVSIMMVLAALGVISTVVFILVPFSRIAYYQLLFFLIGVAASGQNLSFVLLAEKVSVDIKASATALNNSAISIYVAVITLLSSAFINHAVSGSIKNIKPDDFMLGFLILPISYGIALICALFLIKEKRPWFKSLKEKRSERSYVLTAKV